MYVQGGSTWKVKAITEALCGHALPASAISEIDRTLDAGLEAFASRRLEEAFPYLILDARYERVREGGVVRSQAVHIAIGVDWDGRRRIPAVELSARASRFFWGEFLRGLIARDVTPCFSSTGSWDPDHRRGTGDEAKQVHRRADHQPSRRTGLFLVHLLPKAELLDEHLFFSMNHARAVVAGWVEDFNTARPHSAIGYRDARRLRRNPETATGIAAPPRRLRTDDRCHRRAHA